MRVPIALRGAVDWERGSIARAVSNGDLCAPSVAPARVNADVCERINVLELERPISCRGLLAEMEGRKCHAFRRRRSVYGVCMCVCVYVFYLLCRHCARTPRLVVARSRDIDAAALFPGDREPMFFCFIFFNTVALDSLRALRGVFSLRSVRLSLSRIIFGVNSRVNFRFASASSAFSPLSPFSSSPPPPSPRICPMFRPRTTLEGSSGGAKVADGWRKER